MKHEFIQLPSNITITSGIGSWVGKCPKSLLSKDFLEKQIDICTDNKDKKILEKALESIGVTVKTESKGKKSKTDDV